MITQADDLSLVLSGGPLNINPNNSLGGDPSSHPVAIGSLNNLFHNISAERAVDGYVDYRCLYLFNDGPSTVWNVQLYVDHNEGQNAQVEIGADLKDEIQRITISSNVVEGEMILRYKEATISVRYNVDLGVWARNFENSLKDMKDGSGEKYFKNVKVTAHRGGNSEIIFDIRWSGKDGRRDMSEIQLENLGGNFFLPEGEVTIVPSVVVHGSPVNTLAGSIGVETTPPGGITFNSTNPIIIPRLSPNDGLPIWIKRTTPPGASANQSEGFLLKIFAQSLEYNDE